MMKETKSAKEERILNYTIQDISVQDLCPNCIDNVIISIVEGKYFMDLPSTMISESFQRWLKGKGGVFSKDVKKFLNKKPHGKYILIKNEEERSVVRLIEEDEIVYFESRNLVNGKIKDKPYMTLKTFKEDQSLTSTLRYIEETPIVEEDPEEDSLEDNNDDMPPTNSEEDSQDHAMELFGD